MFDFAPAVWRSFPWGHGIQEGQDFTENKEFAIFARNFVGMLDMAIDMLGPDMDLVEEQLQVLGVAHIGYGVMPKHYPLMGRALMDTLEEKLGQRFTKQHKESCNTVYTFMCVSMMQGAFQELMHTYGKHIWQEEAKCKPVAQKTNRDAQAPRSPVKPMVASKLPASPSSKASSTISSDSSSRTSASSVCGSSKTSAAADKPPRAVVSSNGRKIKNNREKSASTAATKVVSGGNKTAMTPPTSATKQSLMSYLRRATK